MKRLIFALFVFALFAFSANAQKAEVIYFKANLGCCQARSCNAIEGDIKAIVEKNFSSDKVTFRQVLLADEANKDLVAKHNAKSQTVVIVSTKKKKETAIDVSDIIRKYARSQSKDGLEGELLAKINEALK